MSDTNPPVNERSAAALAPDHGIAQRTISVRGWRLATAINTVPREALARAALVVLPAADVTWTAYRPILEAFASERRVLALDWLGFGASARPAPSDFAYSADAYATLLEPYLDALGIGRSVLLGNSVGADAAVRYALAHPNRVAGLVLVAPGGFAPSGPRRRLACRLLGTPAITARVEPLLLSMALGPANTATRKVLAAARAERRERPGEWTARIAAYAALWRSYDDPAADLAIAAREVRAPGVVVRGALDVIVSAADAQRAADSFGPHGALQVVLPRAGHLPFLQQPEAFLQAIRGVLATADAR